MNANKENKNTYTICQKKLEEITEIVSSLINDETIEIADIESAICDWPENKYHQNWINVATPQKIAQWVSIFLYSDVRKDFLAAPEGYILHQPFAF
jgi:hypothetical protein